MRVVLICSLAVVAAAVAAPPAAGHAGHGPTSILVENFAFAPARTIVGTNDAVLWFFSGGPLDRNHSITSVAGSGEVFDSDPGVSNPGPKAFGSSFTHVFRSEGTFSYFCKVHPSMRGTVEVRPIDGTIDQIPPTLGRVRLSRKRVCGRRGRACARATLAYDMPEPGDLLVRVQRRVRKRWRTVRVFDLPAKRGRNRRRVSFAGLKRGRYRFVIRAFDRADLASNTVRVGFRVVRRG